MKNSDFVKNVLTVFSGSLIAQVVTFVSYPIITRLFLPAEFSDWALFIAATAIVTVVVSARFEQAIMLPTDDKESEELISVSFTIAFINSLITLLVFGLIYFVFLQNQYPTLFWLIPLSVLLGGVNQLVLVWNTRKKKFASNSMNRVAIAGVTALVSIYLGYKIAGPMGLFIGTIAGQVCGLFVFLVRGFQIRHLKLRIPRKVILNRYKKFATFNTPHALLDSFIDNGLILFIGVLFSEQYVAFYAFAMRILKAPVNMIGSALYQNFFQKYSEFTHQKRAILPSLKIYTKSMLLIGIPITLTFIFISPWLFNLIFGEKWSEAGIVSQYLAPWLLLNFIASPISCLIIIFQEQAKAFYITITDLVIRITALAVGAYLDDFYIFLILLSIGVSILLIYAVMWYHQLANRAELNYES
ncbi:MAG TPA: oligosaccharide flippase family protein [Bacteroidia bacterium]|nr:oligosaccharide flippase family protein [Bacteroidia bacterium]